MNSRPYPTLVPQTNITFLHLPLPEKTKILLEPFNPPISTDINLKGEFSFHKKFMEVYKQMIETFDKFIGEGERARQIKEIVSATRTPLSPFVSIPYELRKHMDRNAPITNAFIKMFEMIFESEVMSTLLHHIKGWKKLKVMCLAEAPGTFPIAILCWIANNHLPFLKRKLYDFRCTTLEPPKDEEESEAALGDKYSLIGSKPDKWIFMDHTSTRDTREFEKSKIRPHSFPIVTGDIGISIASWATTEREMCGLQLGQFVAACISLQEGGVAVLKMFTLFSKSIVSILRVATHCFKKVRIFKPRASHQTNVEHYWIMSGFIVEMFEKIKEDLFRVMEVMEKIKAKETIANEGIEEKREKKYFHIPGYLHGDETLIYPNWFRDKIFYFNEGLLERQLHYNYFNLYYARQYKDYDGESFNIQLKLVDHFKKYSKPYRLAWLNKFPIRRMGNILYEYTGLSRGRKPTVKK